MVLGELRRGAGGVGGEGGVAAGGGPPAGHGKEENEEGADDNK